MGEMQIKLKLEDKVKEVLEQMGARKGVPLYTGPAFSTDLSTANNPVFPQESCQKVLRQLSDLTWHLPCHRATCDDIRAIPIRYTPFRRKPLTQLLSSHRISFPVDRVPSGLYRFLQGCNVSCMGAPLFESADLTPPPPALSWVAALDTVASSAWEDDGSLQRQLHVTRDY